MNNEEILKGYTQTNLTRIAYAESVGLTDGQFKRLLKLYPKIRKSSMVMPPRKANVLMQKQIIFDYQAGMSIPEIITKYSVSKATIYRIVNKNTGRRTFAKETNKLF